MNKLDKLGVEPQIGALICYNPPRYKGIVIAKVIGFTKTGFSISIDLQRWEAYELEVFLEERSVEQLLRLYSYTPRTGFVVIQ